MAQRPHIAWPVQLDSTGRILMVEQGSDREIADCLATCVLWPLGQRDLEPDFGIEDPLFQQGGPDTDHIRQQLLLNEPRAQEQVDLEDDQLTDFIATVRVGFAQTSGVPS